MGTNNNLVRSVMEAYGILESRGLGERIPRDLPLGMISTISYLDALDHILEGSRERTLSDEMRDTMRSAISNVQHRVMTLPLGSELDLGEDDTISQDVY